MNDPISRVGLLNGNVWRVSDGKYTTRYIRANSLDEAKSIYESENKWNKPTEFQVTDEKICAVYFSDCPGSPAYFKGTKTVVMKSARLYIRQWQLDATIERIVEI